MVKYSSERCAKEFSQKSHYDSHKKRKTPCVNNADKIKILSAKGSIFFPKSDTQL